MCFFFEIHNQIKDPNDKNNPSYDVSYVDARLLEQVGLLMQITVGESQISEQKISMSVYHNKRSFFLVDVCSG